MFMLLNSGKHPFYIKGDNRKDYDQKIKTCKITFYNNAGFDMNIIYDVLFKKCFHQTEYQKLLKYNYLIVMRI